ncbi:zinc finger protein 543-like isoform X1 [Conger conger]|uniref:zinc finger protein 543-like isoform X1 n=2 Tax=Conger conger TaxID=82655 RepID=UPI002A5AA786|nr:zinc finger protein 543-like isoform X1 [Conger conger]
MSNFVTFQTQLVSIMEILAKAAVTEINRRVDDSCAVFRLEISQSQREIETLKHKLQVLEREFMKTRRKKPVRSPAIVEHFPPAERVFGQGWSFRPRRREEPTTLEEFRAEPVVIKKERLEEDLCYSDSQPTPVEEEQVTQPIPAGDGKKPDTEPTPVGDPEELSEQHRCGHGDEELSGLEFVGKAEQEEEHVALRLNQTGCEPSAGRLNSLGSEYVMYERDSQLWTSFTQEDSDLETDDPVCSNATEHCSQNLSIHTQLQHAPATMEVSGNTLPSFGASYVEEFDKMGGKPSACGEELGSEATRAQQGQYGERRTRGGRSPAQPLSGSPYGTGSAQSTSAFTAGKKGEADDRAMANYQRAFAGERRFCCTCCGKSFTRFSHLKEHHRSHTGEKPYSCAECGKRFSKQSNLIRHTIVHSGKKPFRCLQCGKCFTQRSSLKSHQRIHAGQVTFPCIQYLYPEEDDYRHAV